MTFRLHTASLLQAMRSTGYVSPYKARCSAVIGWFGNLGNCHACVENNRRGPVFLFQHFCFLNDSHLLVPFLLKNFSSISPCSQFLPSVYLPRPFHLTALYKPCGSRTLEEKSSYLARSIMV